MTVNAIGSVNNTSSIYGLYDSLYQGNLALNLVKMNRDYFPANKTQSNNQLGGDALKYVNNIKAASKNLSNSIKDLSGAAFMKKTPTSSDPEAMSVNYFGTKPDSIKQMTVNIEQTAAGQLNEGSSLKANDSFGSSGTNKFSINIGGKATELTVNVAAGDTNNVVQQKMADAINKAGIGVKATVEKDDKNGTSTLKLESVGTGKNDNNKFSVTDVTGNLAAQTGANQVTREARDAVYSVDGGAKRTSQSNVVDLGNGLSVTFNKASEKAITISSDKDMGYAKSAVEGLVKSYNDLYSEAAQKTNDPKAQNLATKMVNTSKTYFNTLSSIGIGFDGDGKMTLDATRLNEAAGNGNLEKFFTQNAGKNYGFTNQLARLADNVSQNTSNYVTKSVFGNELFENFAYSGSGNLLQYNSMNSGWIFDYLF